MSQPQFNFLPVRTDGPDGSSLVMLIGWLNKQFARLASALKGPQSYDVGSIATSIEITLDLVDLTTVTLTGNAALTLNRAKSRAGAVAYLELTQDATGGRTPTWVNALTTPTVSTTANKKTLLLAVNDGAGWILTTLASAY